MKNKTPEKARSRAEILAEIASLPPSVQGTISAYKNVRKNGTTATYYNLQYTHNGKNHSFAIPVDRVAEFRAAAAAGALHGVHLHSGWVWTIPIFSLSVRHDAR